MSIIYDALKKSQQARATKTPITVSRTKRLPKKNWVITLIILSSIFALIAAFMMSGGSTIKLNLLGHTKPPAKTKPAAIALAAAPRLMLDGVFLSDTEKLAMINRRSYHEGDMINGMKVISIAFDQVRLKSNTHSIVLRNALTQLN